MDNWTKIPPDEVINQTVEALETNGFIVTVVNTKEEAKSRFFELVPQGSEVFTNTSTTLEVLGIEKEINESGKFVSLHNKVSSMPTETPAQKREKKMVGSVPEYAVGSVHAVTLDGRVMMASGSGSQIPGYAYGADHIVWIIGAQKLVRDVDEGLKRIYEYCLPLEDERAKKAYGKGSAVRKILIFNIENRKKRTHAIIVKEVLGF
jgi:hypothetical protein